MVGDAGAEASTTNSYWDKETSYQTESAGGTGKATVEMKAQATYADWNFETIWDIDASKNDGYPFLRSVDFGAPGNPDADAVAAAWTDLTWDTIKGTNSLPTSVTARLNLPTAGTHGTIISWSANPAGWVNTITGAVTRPSNSQGNKTVTLTATISKQGGQSRSKEFTLTIVAMASPGTGSGGGSVTTYHTITATAGSGGTITPKTIKVEENGSQTFTITPDKGYEIEDVLVDGKSIGVKTSYTFAKVTGNHTISATFKEVAEVPALGLPFRDVHESHWFYRSIKYAYEKGLMQGTGPDTFNPLGNTSRAMIVTILHKLEKTPAGLGNIFTDVAEGAWYTEAVNWAAANGIVEGYGNNLFAPDNSVTREQIACILYNYARYAGYNVARSVTLTDFSDGHTTSKWAIEAMEWAVGSGLINGKGNNILDPAGPATRAEIASILKNFIENIVK